MSALIVLCKNILQIFFTVTLKYLIWFNSQVLLKKLVKRRMFSIFYVTDAACVRPEENEERSFCFRSCESRGVIHTAQKCRFVWLKTKYVVYFTLCWTWNDRWFLDGLEQFLEMLVIKIFWLVTLTVLIYSYKQREKKICIFTLCNVNVICYSWVGITL